MMKNLKLLLIVVFLAMFGTTLAQTKSYYVPMVLKYDCDTSKWEWAHTANQYATYYNSIKFRYKNHPNPLHVDIVYRSWIDANTNKEQFITDWQRRTQEIEEHEKLNCAKSTLGKYAVMQCLEAQKDFNNYYGPGERTQLLSTFYCTRIENNHLYELVFIGLARDSNLIKSEMKAVLNSVSIVDTKEMDKVMQLPLTGQRLDSIRKELLKPYEKEMASYKGTKTVEQRLKILKDHYPYLTDEDFKEEGIKSAAVFEAHMLDEILTREDNNLKEYLANLEKLQRSGYSNTALVQFHDKLVKGVYSLDDFMECLDNDNCNNEVCRFCSMYYESGNRFSQLSKYIPTAANKQFPENEFKLQKWESLNSLTEFDGTYRMLFSAEKNKKYVLSAAKQNDEWVYSLQSLSPISIAADGWYFKKIEEAENMILISESSTGASYLGSTDINTNWVLVDGEAPGHEKYKAVYREKVNDYPTGIEYELAEFNTSTSIEEQKIDNLLDSLSYLQYKRNIDQSVNGGYLSKEALFMWDSLSFMKENMKTIVAQDFHDSQKLFISNLHYQDLDEDGQMDAYYFAVSNRNYVYGRRYYVKEGKIIIEDGKNVATLGSKTKPFSQTVLYNNRVKYTFGRE